MLFCEIFVNPKPNWKNAYAKFLRSSRHDLMEYEEYSKCLPLFLVVQLLMGGGLVKGISFHFISKGKQPIF